MSCDGEVAYVISRWMLEKVAQGSLIHSFLLGSNKQQIFFITLRDSPFFRAFFRVGNVMTPVGCFFLVGAFEHQLMSSLWWFFRVFFV